MIRKATNADLSAIQEIQSVSLPASQWNPADYVTYDCLVAESIAGAIEGFLVARQIAAGDREILNLAVRPESRRKGIAKALLETELSRAKGVWFLEVRESNSGAQTFYQHLGFQQVGLIRDYYRNPSESAIVMRFDS
jgi:ribosomal-protein-alanine N-acetyltransferase